MTVAGRLHRLAGGERVLTLAAPDGDGEVRVLREGGGYPLRAEAFEAGGEALSLAIRKPRYLPADELGEPLAALRPVELERLLRALVAVAVEEHFEVGHASSPFVAGESAVPVSGRCYGVEEVKSLTDAALDFWLTTGRFNDRFEADLKGYLGRKHLLTTNSGSSANLLAIAALTSHTLGERALRPGDEVITVAAGFPTTVNPLLQYGLVPVFVDVEIPTYNAVAERVAEAIGERTRAIVLAHTLGNPFDLAAIGALAERHGLWLVEDCCDALGSTYEGRLAGTFGHIATFSFYPAHHITMGEGGAVTTDDPLLKRALESFRDWGRDCWCDPGRDNTCRKRFEWRLGDLPEGYDHKYVYSHVGYNLKITDMQAAVGVAQLQRLEDFIAARKANFRHLREALQPLEAHVILPEATPGSDPAWFGFPLTLREPGRRTGLMHHLNDRRIGTRLLFGGNLTRQPYLAGRRYRVHGSLAVSDRIMNDTFWLGVYPGLDERRLDFMIHSLHDYFRGL